MQGKYF